jgi:hypothetical protein
MGFPAVVAVAGWGLLAAGVGVVAVQNADLARRLEHAEAAAASAATRAEEAARQREQAPAALAQAPRVEPAELAEVKKDVQTLWAQVLGTPAGEAGAAASAAPTGPAFDDAVRRVVDGYVAEKKFRDAVSKAAGPVVPKKPTFHQLAKALDLKADQSERLAIDVREIQTELFEVLSIPRADGVVVLDEIAQAEQYPEGSPQRTAPFLKLFRLKIPDTEETYVERAIALVQGLKERAPQYLAVEQMDVLNSLDLDWFGIKFQ